MTRPLTGWRVLVPRGGAWGSDLIDRLTDAGATAVLVPLIAFEPPEDEAQLTAALQRLAAGEYDWLAITSATAVGALDRHRAVVPERTRIAAVGTHAAKAAHEAGYRVDFVPTGEQSAQSLIAQWPAPKQGQRVLLPQSEVADELLLEGLADLGLAPERVTAYRTVSVPAPGDMAERVAEGRFDAILVTAGSVAARVADEFPEIPAPTRIVCIGPRTAGEAATVGLKVAAIAPERSGASMVDTLISLAADSR